MGLQRFREHDPIHKNNVTAISMAIDVDRTVRLDREQWKCWGSCSIYCNGHVVETVSNGPYRCTSNHYLGHVHDKELASFTNKLGISMRTATLISEHADRV